MVELIEAGEFHAFPDALRFALAVKFIGLKLAAASSSKNADEFLKRNPLDVFAAKWGLPYNFIHEGMTLLNLFDADFSGCDFRARQAPPHDLSDGNAGALFVVEDASSRVQAGADLVVTSLDDVAVNALSEARLDRATIR